MSVRSNQIEHKDLPEARLNISSIPKMSISLTSSSSSSPSSSSSSSSSLNYEQITRNIVIDGNDDNPDYDGSISYCTCHLLHSSLQQTCTSGQCFNYATLTECIKCSSNSCQNNKFTKLYSKKLEVRPVEKKGYGLFCLEDIEKGGDFIKEYVGELISTKEFVRRFFSSLLLNYLSSLSFFSSPHPSHEFLTG